MKITKITSEADYAKALMRIEQLMFNVMPFSPEGEELERLSKMVEEYENENLLYIDDGGKPTNTMFAKSPDIKVKKKNNPK